MNLHLDKCRSIIADPDTPGFVLLTIALWAFGDHVLGDPDEGIEAMDPSELWAAFNEKFDTWVSEAGENKLNALMMAMQGDLLYRDVDIFTSVCAALPDGDLGDLIDGGMADLSMTDILWTMLEVEMAAGHDNDDRPDFSYGVKRIIDEAHAEAYEDMAVVQENLSEAFDDLLARLEYIGVPRSAMRLLDSRYDPDDNPDPVIADTPV